MDRNVWGSISWPVPWTIMGWRSLQPRTGTCRHSPAPPRSQRQCTQRWKRKKKKKKSCLQIQPAPAVCGWMVNSRSMTFWHIYCIYACLSKDMFCFGFGPWGLCGPHRFSIWRTPSYPLVGPTLCIKDGLNCWHSSTDTYSTQKRNSTVLTGLMPYPYIVLKLI